MFNRRSWRRARRPKTVTQAAWLCATSKSVVRSEVCVWEIGCEDPSQSSRTLGRVLPQDQASESLCPAGHDRQSTGCQPWTPSTRVCLRLRV